jgi:hypothetical protein
MHQLRFTAIFLAVAFFLPELSAATWPPTEKSDTYILRYDAIHHPTRAKTGMVVTQNYLASEVGQAILAHGGTETNRKPEQIGGTNRDTTNRNQQIGTSTIHPILTGTNRDIHYSPNPYKQITNRDIHYSPNPYWCGIGTSTVRIKPPFQLRLIQPA